MQSEPLDRARRHRVLGSLHALWGDEMGFGVTTLTPLQEAKALASEGLPIPDHLWDHERSKAVMGLPGVEGAHDVREAFGGRRPMSHRPSKVVDLSGIRTGKSQQAACAGVRAARLCDSTGMRPGEVPRVPIVSTATDNARATFGHLVGALSSSSVLRPLLLEEPGADSVLIRSERDWPVEIKVVAGARAGSTLVARWLAGCIFDEAPRMLGQDEATVNLEEQERAVIGRIRPGGQIWELGSPWAPSGPVYETFQEMFGRPNKHTLVVRGRAFDLNPFWWTPERCRLLFEKDPDAYRTDVLAEFADPETALLPAHLVEASMRSEPERLEPGKGWDYSAGMDPGTRGNAWTLVVWSRDEHGKLRQVLSEEWVGTRQDPLNSKEVLSEVAALVIPYGITSIYTDQYLADPLRDIAGAVGLALTEVTSQGREKAKVYLGIRERLVTNQLEFTPSRQQRADLVAVKRRVTTDGVKIVLPRTGDGRHCDFAPANMVALKRYLDLPAVVEHQIWADPHEEQETDDAERERRDEEFASTEWY